MIGNDIVDLKHIESNWKRPGFLDKVFSFSEQEYIRTSENQHTMVWLLWSMKEAAYKVYVQQHGKPFFNPKRLQCELISEGTGKVYIDNQIYFTTSARSKDYVYTVAKQDLNAPIHTKVFKSEITTYKTQSAVLKQQALKTISEAQGIPMNALSIKKNTLGIPKIFYTSEQRSIVVSLTHCGRFSAYAF